MLKTVFQPDLPCWPGRHFAHGDQGMTALDEFFKERKQQLYSVRDSFKQIESLLPRDVIRGQTDEIRKRLLKILTNGDDQSAANHIANLLRNAEQLSNGMFKDLEKLESAWDFDRRKDAAVRRGERIDLWKLWAESTVRWCFGAALVLLLYSSAVWLSENTCFFHVPIRDVVEISKGVGK